ncbi:MAG: hypothetical protein IKY27_06850 [Bacteroidales bacterium]|nr:hypothetical protein [Bacteroidales bacterium]
MKRLSILLFALLLCMAANAQTPIKDVIQNYKKFKNQAESFADEHEWVSFKYRNIHYYKDSLSWDEEFEVIIKYDGKKSLIFYNQYGIEQIYFLDRDYYKKIEKPEGSLIEYENTIFDFDRHYEALGKYGFVPRYFRDIPYYIYPISFAESMNLTQVFTDVEKREIDGELYNIYKFDNDERSVCFYVNATTNIMDSAYCEVFEYHSKDHYTFYDFNYDNRQTYIDSIFNFENKEYEKYSRYNMATPSPYWSIDTIVTDKLLDFPLVDLMNDTTSLREHEGWILLNFWTFNYESCMKQLERYAQEKDSLGYRIIEKEGVKIMAINYLSNNMKYIEKVAKRFDCDDIIYSGKEIYSVIYPSCYYYLISPDKKVVLTTNKLEDYEEILRLISN